LFAVLQRGGVPVDAFTQLVSKDIVQILQALVILFVAAEAMFRPLQKWIRGRGKGEAGGRGKGENALRQEVAVVGQQAGVGKI
jgi:hypothetical protein